MSATTTQQEWQARYADALMDTFGTPQRVLVRGEGAYVWDADGNRYLDLLAGIAVNALGHAHPAVIKAVSAQLGTLGPRLQLLRDRAPDRARRAAARSAGRPTVAGVLHQLRHRGERGRVQAGAPHRRRTARPRRCEGLPRPHDGRARADRARRPTGSRSSRCPAASTSCRTATSKRSRAAVDDDRRRGRPRADPGRGRRCGARPPATWAARAITTASTARCSCSTRCRPASAAPARGSRTTDRRRRRARRRHARQGPRRWLPDRRVPRGAARPRPARTRATTARRSAATRSRRRGARRARHDRAATACSTTRPPPGERLRAGLAPTTRSSARCAARACSSASGSPGPSPPQVAAGGPRRRLHRQRRARPTGCGSRRR